MPKTANKQSPWGAGLVIALALTLGLGGPLWGLGRSGPKIGPLPLTRASWVQDRVAIPPNVFNQGVGWINTSSPVSLAELRGKIVLLDFWTYCCINCHHILPDLEYLEKKYPNELVVIGVHSAKFDAEKDTENIRRKVAEYRIKHPVVNDAEMAIWRTFDVSSWPTLALIDANGRLVGKVAGEGKRAVLDQAIGRLVKEHRARGEINEAPFVFAAESAKPHDQPLLYPGKVLADVEGKRLFISDTGHNRIVVADLEGKFQDAIGNGATGLKDGKFEDCSLNRQQGMCLVGNVLYIADVENHAIRAADLTSRQLTTVAGTGQQDRRFPPRGRGNAKTFELNSPWDLVQVPGKNQLIIAMAGPHQIWKLDLDQSKVEVWAGSGVENIVDGSASAANFAQPSGVTTDGQVIYVADSEVSGIRRVALPGGRTTTLIGAGLFDFADIDGPFGQARLQHCLGVSYGGGKLYVADTYNNKIKACDFKRGVIETIAGNRSPGKTDNPPKFYQPGGVSYAGDRLYVADSNNHAIRVIDLATNAVRTLALEGVKPPSPPRRPPNFPLAQQIKVEPVKVRPGDEMTLSVSIALPQGFKLGPDTPMPYLVESPDQKALLGEGVDPNGSKVEPPATSFRVKVPLAKKPDPGQKMTLRLSVGTFICQGEQGFCRPKSYVWTVPIEFASDGKSTVELK